LPCVSDCPIVIRVWQDMCIDTIFQCHCMDEEYSAQSGYQKKTPGASLVSLAGSLSFVGPTLLLILQ
jgi:hypothetical protein